MSFRNNKYELAAKTSYEDARARRMISGEPWDKTDETTRNHWLSVVQIAVNSYPGPIAFQVSARFPHRTKDHLPILRDFSCEATSEDIERACAELQSWLEENTYDRDDSTTTVSDKKRKGPPPLPKKDP